MADNTAPPLRAHLRKGAAKPLGAGWTRRSTTWLDSSPIQVNCSQFVCRLQMPHGF